MKKTVSLILALVLLVALAACGSSSGSTPAPSAPDSAAPSAEATPKWTKNVEVQVPAGAGGGTDVAARTLTSYVSQNSGSNLTIVNNSDGGGVVAFEKVRGAKSDGSTILFFHTAMLIKSATGIYDKTAAEDFTVIAVAKPVEAANYVLVTSADSGLSTLEDFLAEAKSKPGELLVGVETGGSSHIMSGLMAKGADISVKFVEAGPDTEKMTALVGNSINACLVNVNQAKQYVEAGKVNALAVVSIDSNGGRSSVLPEVPSFVELGVDFTFGTYFFVLGPKSMDESLAESIHSYFAAAGEDGTVNSVLTPAGLEMRFVPFAEGADTVRAQQEALNAVVAELGLKK